LDEWREQTATNNRKERILNVSGIFAEGPPDQDKPAEDTTVLYHFCTGRMLLQLAVSICNSPKPGALA